MKRLGLFLSLLVPCVSYAEPKAQPTPQPLPSGPLLVRAPEFSQWVITFNPQNKEKAGTQPGASSSAPAQAEPKLMTVTKTKTIYHEESVDTLGHKRDSWRVGALQINTVPGSRQRIMLDESSFGVGGPDPAVYTDYSKTDFSGLEWVSAKNYVDVRKVMGVDCIIFRNGPASAAGPAAQGSPGQTQPSPAPSSAGLAEQASTGLDQTVMTACINLESRLPVLVQQDNETRVYQFAPPPAAMLTLPADIQAALDERSKRLEEMARRPARPF